MFRPESTDGRLVSSARPPRRLGAGALALGSGYQRNRDVLEPELRAGVDLLALLARQAALPSPGPATLVPPADPASPAAPGAAR